MMIVMNSKRTIKRLELSYSKSYQRFYMGEFLQAVLYHSSYSHIITMQQFN